SCGNGGIPEGSPPGRRQCIGEMMMTRRTLLDTLAGTALATMLFAVSAPVYAQSADERLDALDARITRLEDMNQIERLQRTYGYFVDKSQWTPLSELFAEDATLEIGGKGIFLGKHRVLEYMHTAF